MKEKELFIKALNGLFFYWGSDAPPEAYWAANDLLDWYEKEYDVLLNIRFEEENVYKLVFDNFDKVIEAIKNN